MGCKGRKGIKERARYFGVLLTGGTYCAEYPYLLITGYLSPCKEYGMK